MGKKIITILIGMTCLLSFVGCSKDNGESTATDLKTADIVKPAEELKLEFNSKEKVNEVFPDNNGDTNLRLSGMTDIFIETINEIVMKIDYKYKYESKSEGFNEEDGKGKLFYEIGRKSDYLNKGFFNNDKISLIQSELTIDPLGTTDMYFSVTFKDLKDKEDLQLTERDKDLLKALWEDVNIDAIQDAINQSYEKETEDNKGIVDISVPSGKDNVKISVYPLVGEGTREVSVIIYMSM